MHRDDAACPRRQLRQGLLWRWALAAWLAGGLGGAASGLWPAPALAQQQPAQLAQPAPAQSQDGRLTQPQLEQLLAPIALYPDSLLAQVLMAATYPLEVVQAKRWLDQGQNKELKGEDLSRALEAQPWDPSVKSLVPFPDVLNMMNEQLEWTQRVGDAVLAQQDDVMNTVQVLRGRAQANNQLQSGPQQTVTVSQATPTAPASSTTIVQAPAQVIAIQPTDPQVVYVPAYNPSVVYGSWPYPQYPPAYYPPPAGWGVGNALLRGMAFATGAAVVGPLWGWARPGWGRGDIDVNVNRYNSINVNRTQIASSQWRHDAAHRQGVAYSDQAVRDRYRGSGAAGAEARDRAQAREQFRGRVDQAERGSGPVGGERRPDAGQRPGLADRGPSGGGRADAARPAQRPSVAQSGRPQVSQPRPQTREAPAGMQGIDRGGEVRAAQQRGSASRQAQARSQPAQRPQAARSGGAGGNRAAARGGGGAGGPRR